jgi:hypothetical protein
MGVVVAALVVLCVATAASAQPTARASMPDLYTPLAQPFSEEFSERSLFAPQANGAGGGFSLALVDNSAPSQTFPLALAKNPPVGESDSVSWSVPPVTPSSSEENLHVVRGAPFYGEVALRWGRGSGDLQILNISRCAVAGSRILATIKAADVWPWLGSGGGFTGAYVPGTSVVAYVTGSGGLATLNIVNPASPQVLGVGNNTHAHLGVFVMSDVWVPRAGGYAYVASSGVKNPGTVYANNSLTVFDVSDPSNPVAVGEGARNSRDDPVCIRGHEGSNVVAIGGFGYVFAFDVGTPSAPIALGRQASGAFIYPRSLEFSADGDVVYAGTSNTQTGEIAAFNVTRTGSGLIPLSRPAVPGTPKLRRIGKDLLFAGSRSFNSGTGLQSDGAFLVDISDPASPKMVGTSVYRPANTLRTSGYDLIPGSGFIHVGCENGVCAQMVFGYGRTDSYTLAGTPLTTEPPLTAYIRATGFYGGSAQDLFVVQQTPVPGNPSIPAPPAIPCEGRIAVTTGMPTTGVFTTTGTTTGAVSGGAITVQSINNGAGTVGASFLVSLMSVIGLTFGC